MYKRGALMDLKNYELSDYEEYLLKRTGTENVSFADGMVYATYHPESNTTSGRADEALADKQC